MAASSPSAEPQVALFLCTTSMLFSPSVFCTTAEAGAANLICAHAPDAVPTHQAMICESGCRGGPTAAGCRLGGVSVGSFPRSQQASISLRAGRHPQCLGFQPRASGLPSFYCPTRALEARVSPNAALAISHISLHEWHLYRNTSPFLMQTTGCFCDLEHAS